MTKRTPRPPAGPPTTEPSGRSRPCVTATVSPEAAQALDEMVASGRWPSRSAVVEAALLELYDRQPKQAPMALPGQPLPAGFIRIMRELGFVPSLTPAWPDGRPVTEADAERHASFVAAYNSPPATDAELSEAYRLYIADQRKNSG